MIAKRRSQMSFAKGTSPRIQSAGRKISPAMKRAAATDIQRIFRGHRVRRDPVGKTFSAQLRMARRRLRHVSPMKRASASRKSASLALKHSASVNIQRAFRGFRHRKNFAYKKAAATNIQRAFRRHKASEPAWFGPVKNFAARNIQRVYRGHLARKSIPRKNKNVVPSHPASVLNNSPVKSRSRLRALGLGLLAASTAAMLHHSAKIQNAWRPYT